MNNKPDGCIGWYAQDPCKSCKHNGMLHTMYEGVQKTPLCNGPYNCITEQVEPEFKPCPLCDNAMKLDREEEYYGVFYSLYCDNDDCPLCRTRAEKDKYELARKWNFPTRINI